MDNPTVRPPQRDLIVYAEQDGCTGLWTVDIPELWIIGHQARGNLHTVIESAAPGIHDDRRLDVRTFDGADYLSYG